MEANQQPTRSPIPRPPFGASPTPRGLFCFPFFPPFFRKSYCSLIYSIGYSEIGDVVGLAPPSATGTSAPIPAAYAASPRLASLLDQKLNDGLIGYSTLC